MRARRALESVGVGLSGVLPGTVAPVPTGAMVSATPMPPVPVVIIDLWKRWEVGEQVPVGIAFAWDKDASLRRWRELMDDIREYWLHPHKCVQEHRLSHLPIVDFL